MGQEGLSATVGGTSLQASSRSSAVGSFESADTLMLLLGGATEAAGRGGNESTSHNSKSVGGDTFEKDAESVAVSAPSAPSPSYSSSSPWSGFTSTRSSKACSPMVHCNATDDGLTSGMTSIWSKPTGQSFTFTPSTHVSTFTAPPERMSSQAAGSVCPPPPPPPPDGGCQVWTDPQNATPSLSTTPPPQQHFQISQQATSICRGLTSWQREPTYFNYQMVSELAAAVSSAPGAGMMAAAQLGGWQPATHFEKVDAEKLCAVTVSERPFNRMNGKNGKGQQQRLSRDPSTRTSVAAVTSDITSSNAVGSSSCGVADTLNQRRVAAAPTGVSDVSGGNEVVCSLAQQSGTALVSSGAASVSGQVVTCPLCETSKPEAECTQHVIPVCLDCSGSARLQQQLSDIISHFAKLEKQIKMLREANHKKFEAAAEMKKEIKQLQHENRLLRRGADHLSRLANKHFPVTVRDIMGPIARVIPSEGEDTEFLRGRPASRCRNGRRNGVSVL